MKNQNLEAEEKLQANFDRLTSFAESLFSTYLKATCILCGRTYTDPIEIMYLKTHKYCLGCENVRLDVEQDRRAQ